MTVLLVLAGVAFTAFMLYLTLKPLFSSRDEAMRVEHFGEDLQRIELLMARRKVLVASLRELEFEKETNKVAADDYERFRARYEREAVIIMKRLDDIHGGRGWQERVDTELETALGHKPKYAARKDEDAEDPPEEAAEALEEAADASEEAADASEETSVGDESSAPEAQESADESGETASETTDEEPESVPDDVADLQAKIDENRNEAEASADSLDAASLGLTCSECQEPLEADDKFCSQCGTPVQLAPSEEEPAKEVNA